MVLFASDAHAQQTAVLKKEIRGRELQPGIYTAGYRFVATVDGSATSPQPPVSVTRPNASTRDSLVFNSMISAWEFQQAAGASLASMNAAFPNGTYTLTLGNRSIPIALDGDLYPAPIFTLPSFNVTRIYTNPGGVTLVDPDGLRSLTFAFRNNFLAGSSRITIRLTNVGNGPAVNLSVTSNAQLDQSQLTLTIPSGTIVAGGLYRCEVEATRVVATDATSVSGYTVTSAYSYTVEQHFGVVGPPVFFTQPQNLTTASGSTATFSPAVANSNGVTYQWQKNGAAVAGATNATLTFASAQAGDAGSYSVVATNSSGSTTSAAATLTLTGPPVISAHPASLVVTPGSTVVFNAAATGATGVAWRRDGTPISGSSGSTLVLTGANVVAGSYTFFASNSAGTVSSTPATLSVSNNPDSGRLSNLAIRTNAGTGAQTLIVGFAVGGAGTTGTKPLLIRGVGPSLNQFGLTGVLADPVATVFQGPATVATNDNWGGDAQVVADGTRLGAFGFTGPTSLDAAFVASPAVGSYSVQITGKNNGTGIALAEIYDASVAPLGATTPRLVNVSARTQVGTGGDILIAGFNIGGATARTVLIRAIGPELGIFGVGGTLSDPKIQLFSGTTVLRENDDWGGDTQAVALGSSVGAFALSNPASKDSVLLVTLPPGSYTAQVSGAGGSSGVALIEVYEIP